LGEEKSRENDDPAGQHSRPEKLRPAGARHRAGHPHYQVAGGDEGIGQQQAPAAAAQAGVRRHPDYCQHAEGVERDREWQPQPWLEHARARATVEPRQGGGIERRREHGPGAQRTHINQRSQRYLRESPRRHQEDAAQPEPGRHQHGAECVVQPEGHGV